MLELERRNADVRSAMEVQTETRIRVEQELGDLVDEFNDLMDQRRYAEAQVIAKQAKELDPDNPVTEALKLKSMFAYRDREIGDIRDMKEEARYGATTEIEKTLIYDATSPISFPDAKEWAALNEASRTRRGQHASVGPRKRFGFAKHLRALSRFTSTTPRF